MASDVNKTIALMWRERIPIMELKVSKKVSPNVLTSPKFAEQLVHVTFNGMSSNPLFAKYLLEGVSLNIFQPTVVMETIQKLSLGSSLDCFSTSIDVLKKCISVAVSNTTANATMFNVCKMITSTTVWLIENTIEVYKVMYNSMEEAVLTDPEYCLLVIGKSHELLKKLLFNKEVEDLNLVGKALLSADDISMVQVIVQNFLSTQFNKNNTVHPLYSAFEVHANELVKMVAKFLNPPIHWNEGRISTEAQHIFTEFQVLACMSTSSAKLADVFCTFFQNNYALVAQCTSLVSFVVQNILKRENTIEVQAFTAFLFIKIPAVMWHLEGYYKQLFGDQSLIVSTCQQIASSNIFAELDKKLECNSYMIFINQCKMRNRLDDQQHQLLVSLNKTTQQNENLDSLANKLLLLSKKTIEILKVLLLPLNENKEKVSVELGNLINSADLPLMLIALSMLDEMDSLLSALFKINKHSERSQDGTKEALSEVRADLFNNSFILLAYIDTLFSDEVFASLSKNYEDMFFLTWRQQCQQVTRRKNYTQSVLDGIIESLLNADNGYTTPTNNLQWDEYCWSAGMIVKELTQAHLRRHITTDDLQKVCEGFKNKRPALCVCAMVWLCAQYRTMPTSERARTVKIIRLFKRPLVNANRAAVLSPILNRYSLELEGDLQPNNKGKSVSPLPPKSISVIFSEIVEELFSNKTSCVHINNNILQRFRDCLMAVGRKSFARSLVILILDSGKEEEAVLHETVCLCLLLLDPVQLLIEVFQETIFGLFRKQRFADPQGLCLARCISKAFSITLILNEVNPKENPRPAKMMKTEDNGFSKREKLVDTLSTFLSKIQLYLRRNETSVESVFICNLLEQLAVACTNQTVQLKQESVYQLLETLPGKLSRHTLAFLCDLTTTQGCDHVARYLMKSIPPMSL